MTEQTDRPDGCCGVCPGIVGGGYDCTCADNPDCPLVDPVALADRWYLRSQDDDDDLGDVSVVEAIGLAHRLATENGELSGNPGKLPATDDVVERARQHLAAITPGPWYAEPRDHDDVYRLTMVYNVFHNGDTPDRDLVAEVAYDNADFIAAAPVLVADLVAEAEKQRAAIMRVIAACVEADIESIAFNGEPGVIKTTTIRSALNGGPDEH
ncbi:hypothetical protein [Gordonia alkaliphila]|uniref:Uncharacterized protein n=1 Tax=Gordonia alkaliphila TaxID=1053547 RepID=A0ABP8ZGM9_9ACTN